MAWSWSHTPEAYANAQANLEDLPLETLRVIEAEWRGRLNLTNSWGDPELSLAKYAKAVKAIEREDMPADYLCGAIWERASEQAICDNGGYNAWMCPFGCHTVPFDKNNHPLYEQWLALKQDGSTRMTFHEYKACTE